MHVYKAVLKSLNLKCKTKDFGNRFLICLARSTAFEREKENCVFNLYYVHCYTKHLSLIIKSSLYCGVIEQFLCA